MIRKDHTVNIEPSPELLNGIIKFEAIYRLIVGREPIATSMKDSFEKHIPNSKHRVGDAVDIRAMDIPLDIARQIVVQFLSIEGSRYKLLLHGDVIHFHLEVIR